MFRQTARTSLAVALASVAVVGSMSAPAAAQPATGTGFGVGAGSTAGESGHAGLATTRADSGVGITEYEDGMTVDATWYATDRGISLAAAQAALATQRDVSDALGRLQSTYPDSYAGGEVRHSPQVHGVARFVGTVPPGASEVVGSAPVSLQGGADVTLAVLRSRENVVHDDLVAQGRPQVTTSYDMMTSTVEVTIKLRPEEEGQPRETLVAGLPASARNPGVYVDFVSGDISVDEHTRGGAMAPADAGGYCTTGFTVSSSGVYGYVTAGHCDNGLNYQEPEVGGALYDAPWQAGHRGQWGDFQWHTTPHNEYAEFYSGTTTIREVNGYDSVISVGELVCKNGRTSGYGCSYIYKLDVSVTVDGYHYDRLVAVEDYITDSGDSGGPWFFGNDSVGVHKGYTTIWFSRRSLFSAIYYMDNALGLALLVSP